MSLYNLVRPAFFALSPEQAHTASLLALKNGMVHTAPPGPDPRLQCQLAGINFPNPVGLAAGYDKNAEAFGALLKLGFGFVEVGTLTPKAQAGNPKPRIFRLVQERGLINRLGFNNDGHGPALKRLSKHTNGEGIIGVNIGANKDTNDFVSDYETGIERFYEVATYFTANISSPNTPGLRNLQAGEALSALLARIFAKRDECKEKHGRDVLVFLKIAPDLNDDELREIADVVNSSQLSALIISNTTLDRDMLVDKTHANEAGGLSGAPLFEKSTHILAKMYALLGGQIPLVGVGGIASAKDALTKIKAGASLVQLYSCMVYEGPCLPGRIVREMSQHLDDNEITHISDLIGTENDQWV